MFEKVTNTLGDKISKEHLVSIQHYVNISDKLKISNLYFLIFIVQINKVPIVI